MFQITYTSCFLSFSICITVFQSLIYLYFFFIRFIIIVTRIKLLILVQLISFVFFLDLHNSEHLFFKFCILFKLSPWNLLCYEKVFWNSSKNYQMASHSFVGICLPYKKKINLKPNLKNQPQWSLSMRLLYLI